MAVGDFTPKRIYGPAQPGTSTAVLVTVPASRRWIVNQIRLANTTGSTATVTLGIGGTTAANQIVPAVSIPANTVETLEMAEPMVAGETLDGLQGTASAITVVVSIVEEEL